MGYTQQNGQYADTEDVILHASAARTADGDGTGVEFGDRSTLRLLLDVTAVSGTTPQILVVVETSHNNSDWRAIDTFDIRSTTGQQRLSVGGLDRFARVRWDLSGTDPSFTFSVSGEAA